MRKFFPLISTAALRQSDEGVTAYVFVKKNIGFTKEAPEHIFQRETIIILNLLAHFPLTFVKTGMVRFYFL